MDILVYLVANIVYYLIAALQLIMLVRAIMSWFMTDDSNRIYAFTVLVTEPIIAPVRALLDRIDFLRNLPLDLSFIVTYILLALIQALLAAFG